MKSQNAKSLRLATLAALSLTTAACASSPGNPAGQAGLTVPIGSAAPAPRGYQAMCRENADLCRPAGKGQENVRHIGRKDALSLLSGVNRSVNRAVRPREDNYLLVGDDWRRPLDGTGDCEDYALEKREQLRLRGFPIDKTFLAVVYSREAGLHTVLVATVEGRDYVMDNLSPWVLPWRDAPYEFVKREAPQYAAASPGRWVLAFTTVSPPAAVQTADMSVREMRPASGFLTPAIEITHISNFGEAAVLSR